MQKVETRKLHDQQIFEIILNDEKNNVLDIEMLSQINQVLQSLEKESSIKAIILKAEGKNFSFGASVEEHQPASMRTMLGLFHQTFKLLISLKIPTFSIVQGYCLGGGLELAAFCNFIFAEPSAKFGQPEVNLGVFPPVASLILPKLIGQIHADDLILSGKIISSEEAKQIRLIYLVSENPANEVLKYIETHVLSKSASSLRFAITSARYRMYQDFLRDIEDLEKIYFDKLMKTNDAQEGIESFLQKRNPVWKNC